MRDYNIEFQLLVNDAIKDGWTPVYVAQESGSDGWDYYLGCGDIASDWFRFDKKEE